MLTQNIFRGFLLSGTFLSLTSVALAAPDIPLVDPTTDQLAQIAKVHDDVIGQLTGMAPTPADLAAAQVVYDMANIVINGTQITGTLPVELRNYGTQMQTFARDWRLNGNTDSLTKASNGIWLALANDRVRLWYDTRQLNAAIALLCNDAEGPGGEALRTYVQSRFDHIWKFDPTLEGENTDNIYTGMISLLGMAAHCGDDAHRLQQLRLVKDYLQRALEFSPGTSDFIKVDGSTFHHFAHYPAYMYALRVLLQDDLMRVRGTEFQINAESYEHFRDTALTYLLYSTGFEPTGYISNSMSGRHPFGSANPFAQDDYRDLAMSVGGEILGTGVDTKVAKFYNWMWPGQTPELESYGAEEPIGFWQFNYGVFGIYRGGRGSSFATLKGFNSMAWGTETYATDNRFGRYQSYGTLEVAYPGTYETNGYVPDGWDWNQPPGTTTVHLPWSDLAVEKEQQYETTGAPFAGALSFPRHPDGLFGIEGDVGIFAMNFGQRLISSTHDPAFRFKKSVIAFDGMLLALGSNIINNNAKHPTRTNLFQRHVTVPVDPKMPTVIIDGMAEESFPYDYSLDVGAAHWIIDSRNTGYLLPPGNDAIRVLGRSQTSPKESDDGTMTTGDFGMAWIDHGPAPVDAGYEFVVVPAVTSTEMAEIAAKPLGYRIHERGELGHVVEFPETATWAYSIFEAGPQATNGPITSASEPCLVMTRDTATGMLLSIANPDMKIGYASSAAAPIVPITLGIRGMWEMPKLPPGVTVGTPASESDPNELILTFDTVSGLPIDIELERKPSIEESASNCGCRTVGASETPWGLSLTLATILGGIIRRRRFLGCVHK